MKTNILLSVFFVLSAQGGPLPESITEREQLIRDFIKSDDLYQICITNIIFQGSFPESEGEKTKADGESGSGSGGVDTFQQCMQEAFNTFTEQSGRSIYKRYVSEPHASFRSGPFPGMPNVTNNQIQQCMQQAIQITDNKQKQSEGLGETNLNVPNFSSRTFQECIQTSMTNFQGAGSFPDLPDSNGNGKQKRSPGETEGGSESSSAGGAGGFAGLSQSQIQECMQNSVSIPWGGFGGKSKRSADKEEGSSSGGGSFGFPGFNNDKFQSCIQSTVNNFSGGSGFPGLLGGSGKQKRSPGETEGGSESSSAGGAGGFAGLSQSQIQECMQNSVSIPWGGFGGKSKRSADKEEGSSSGGGSFGFPGFNSDKFQSCIQSTVNNFSGGSGFPGLLGGSGKQKRSPGETEGVSESSSAGGAGGFAGLSQSQIQECMQNSVSIPWGGFGGKSKRSADKEEGSSSGGGSFGFPGFNNDKFQSCIQSTVNNFSGGSGFPGLLGGSGKQKRSPGETEGVSESSSAGGAGGFAGLSQSQIQECMQNSVSIPWGGFGGKSKRSADKEEGSSSGGGSFGFPGFNNDKFQSCIQSTVNNFSGGSGFPGLLGGSGKQKRSPGETEGVSESSSAGGAGGFAGLSQSQIQECMQNSVSIPWGGFGGKSKRSADKEEGSSSGGGSFGFPGFNNDKFQSCIQSTVNNFSGGSRFPGLLGGSGKQKRSPGETDGGSESSSAGGAGGFAGLSQSQIQECMQNSVSIPWGGFGGKSKRSADKEEGSSSGGGSFGFPGFNNDKFQSCIQSTVNNFSGGSGFPGLLGGSGKQKRSPGETEGGSESSSAGGAGGFAGLSQSQIQECMQNSVSIPWGGFGGKSKRSADKEEGSSSGGGSFGFPGFNSDKFQSCIQSTVNNFSGGSGFPGLLGGSGKQKRSPGETEGVSESSSAGGAGGFAGLSQSQIQECMQNSVSIPWGGFGGKSKRSADKEEGSSSGGGSFGFPGFNNDKFQSCIQSTVNNFSGGSGFPGLLGGSGKQKRSPGETEGVSESSSAGGAGGFAGLSQSQIQECMQNSVSIPWGGFGGKSKRSADKEEGSSSGGGSFGFPGFNNDKFQSCIQSTVNNFSGGSGFPGLLGGSGKQKRSPGETEGVSESSSAGGAGGFAGLSQSQIQECMQNSVSIPWGGFGGKSKRSADKEEGSSSGGGSFGFPGFNNDKFQSCIQSTVNNFSGGSRFPGLLGGSGKQKRSPGETDGGSESSSAGGAGGFAGLSQSQIQECMQNSVSIPWGGFGGKSKRSADKEEGSSSGGGSFGFPGFNNDKFQSCIQSTVNNFSGGSGFPGLLGGSGKQKRSPGETEGVSESSSAGGAGGFAGLSQSQIQECMQNSVSIPWGGFGGKSKRSADKEEGSSSGGGSFGFPGFNNDKFQSCIQSTVNNFSGGSGFPGLLGGSGKQKRSPGETEGVSESSSAGGAGGFAGLSQSQIQECMQNSVSIPWGGFGGKSKRSADKEEGSSSGGGSFGFPGFNNDKFQSCIQSTVNNFSGGSGFPGLPGGSGKQKMSPGVTEGGSESSFAVGKEKRSLPVIVKRSAQDYLKTSRVSYMSHSKLH